ncbi:hypothetical protein K474DRAFT_516878 [Panus rudis PR-1116 ss-1]|nr:hypothetical protein K474DRAFT_516878 [Panus rudis PR-1116 ss-1]
MSKLPVVLYHYDASPYATKVKNILLLKHIPHKRVAVPMTLPRPELSEKLGVTYRRIPVLAIGNDVYCDTSLIASVLERRFPSSEGYKSLFPPRRGGGKSDTGIVKALSKFWLDIQVFPLASGSLPYGKFDPNFIKDRSAWLGFDIDPKALEARQPLYKSMLASHLALLEEQLSDGRTWLLDTKEPSLADISAHFVFSWIRYFRVLKDLFVGDTFAKTVAWLDRMSEHLAALQKAGAAAFEDVSAEDGATLITGSPATSRETVTVDPAQAKLLGIERGQLVSVLPTDNAKVPTVGKLVALDRERVSIEVKGIAGVAVCHFPRFNFAVKTAEGTKPKL